VGAFLLTDALDLKPDSPSCHDDIVNALRPIKRGIFRALSIPVCEVDEKTACAMRRGKPLSKGLPRIEASALRAAVFCGDSFIALLERPLPPGADSPWRYAFVF
jgi:hypothetical protein